MAFRIKLDDKHYLNSDGLCYYITTAVKSESGKTYDRRTSGYVRSILGAFNSYIDKRIVSSESEDIKALTEEVEELKAEIRAWLADLGEELRREACEPKPPKKRSVRAKAPKEEQSEESMKIKAKLIRACKFPNCEECEDYAKHPNGDSLCKVPIIISKQEFLMLHGKIRSIDKKIDELEDYVY